MLKKFMLVVAILILGVSIVTGIKVYATSTNGAETVTENGTSGETVKTNNGVGLIAAALAIGLSAIGSGIDRKSVV